MKKSITKNYIYNLIYQIIVLLIPLITAPYLSRVLGAENIGIYSYTSSITVFFILFGTLGITLYGQREIAYKQKNKKEYSKIFWEIIILRTITMTISLMVYYFLFINGNNAYCIYYKILIIELIGNLIDISWFFQGLEEFKKTVIRNTFVRLFSLILILTLVKKSSDLPIYFGIYVLSTFLGNLSLWLYLPKLVEKVKFRQLKILKHLKPTIGLFIPQIAIQLYTVLDRSMIGMIISDKSEVGYYDQAQKITHMLLTIITSLGTVMLPRIASTFALGKKDQIEKYIYNSFNMVFFLAFPLMLGLIAVSNSFVPVFFGNGYSKVSILMKIICPIILLIGVGSITGTQYLLPTKRQKEYTISVIMGAFVNLIINLILIKKYGAVGASIGTVLAELTVSSIQLFFLRKDFKLKKILCLMKNYLFASVIMLLCCFYVDRIISSDILSVVIQMIIGASIYMLLLLIFKDKFFLENINKITDLFKRKKVKKI